MLNLKLITPELLASVLTVTSTVWLLENTHKCAGTHTVMHGQMLESAYLETHSPILTESLTHLSPRHTHTHVHTYIKRFDRQCYHIACLGVRY